MAIRGLRLHPSLQAGLQHLNLKTLTPFQGSVRPTQVLTSLCDREDTLIMAETGTGKSTACLLYALNRILSESNRDFITHSLKDRTFDDIFPEFSAAKTKEVAHSSTPHGALVLVPTRELILQHYKLMRRLDTAQSIAMHRTTSIADLAAIAKHVVRTMQQPADNMNSIVERYGFTNMVKTLDWRLLDVVISTPKTLNDLLRQKIAIGQMDFNPAVVYLDECDILFM